MASSQGCQPVLATTTKVFQEGDLQYRQLNVQTSWFSSSAPPRPLLVFTPIVHGAYPVILFCHGYNISNSSYSRILGHIASHGFIVVAPLLRNLLPMLELQEVKYAGKVVDWIADHLQARLPENVEAKLDSLILTGHSRGGKTAFAVALGHAQTKLKLSVLVGIDPVAGENRIIKILPIILTGEPQSFNISIPVAVIGTGLGPEGAIPCAPDGDNHQEFFRECKPPCAHFVATEYGHMDMLDDGTGALLCKSGTGPRDWMRRTVGGLVVAFVRAYLNGQREDLDAILANPDLAPAKLDPPVELRA